MARWSCLAIVFALSAPVVAAEKPRGFDSPVAAFHAYVSAAAVEDYDGMLATLTPQARAWKVTIDGDSATAKVTMAAPAKDVFAGLRDDAKFRRIGKRWFCDFDPR